MFSIKTIVNSIVQKPELFQTAGLAILTIIIPLSIGIIIELLRDKLSLKVFLSEVLKLKISLVFIIFTVFFIPLVFLFGNFILNIIGIVIWFLGFIWLIKLLFWSIDWIIGNKWRYVMKYFRKNKSIEDWNMLWDKDNIPENDENQLINLFFEKCMKKIEVSSYDNSLVKVLKKFTENLKKRDLNNIKLENALKLYLKIWEIKNKELSMAPKSQISYEVNLLSYQVNVLISKIIEKIIEEGNKDIPIVIVNNFLEKNSNPKFWDNFVNEILLDFLINNIDLMRGPFFPPHWFIDLNDVKNQKSLGWYVAKNFFDRLEMEFDRFDRLEMEDEKIKLRELREFIKYFFRNFDLPLLSTWLIFFYCDYSENECEDVIKKGRWKLYISFNWPASPLVKERVEEEIRKKATVELIKQRWKIDNSQVEKCIEMLKEIDDNKLSEEEKRNKKRLENLFTELKKSFEEQKL